MDTAEAMTKFVIRYVLDNCPDEMAFFNQFIDKGCLLYTSPWSTVGCSGCWAADRSVYNTPAGMQKLQFSGRADGAEYRTSAIIRCV